MQKRMRIIWIGLASFEKLTYGEYNDQANEFFMDCISVSLLAPSIIWPLIKSKWIDKKKDDFKQFSRKVLISNLILDLKFLAARVKKGFWSPCWKSACEVLNLVLLAKIIQI